MTSQTSYTNFCPHALYTNCVYSFIFLKSSGQGVFSFALDIFHIQIINVIRVEFYIFITYVYVKILALLLKLKLTIVILKFLSILAIQFPNFTSIQSDISILTNSKSKYIWGSFNDKFYLAMV